LLLLLLLLLIETSQEVVSEAEIVDDALAMPVVELVVVKRDNDVVVAVTDNG
jgi:hypothetical protein